MEPEVRKYLTTILNTMSMALLWLLINTLFGIKMGLLFWGDVQVVWHVVYYIGMVVSFVFLLRYIIKKWKEVPRFGADE